IAKPKITALNVQASKIISIPFFSKVKLQQPLLTFRTHPAPNIGGCLCHRSSKSQEFLSLNFWINLNQLHFRLRMMLDFYFSFLKNTVFVCHITLHALSLFCP